MESILEALRTKRDLKQYQVAALVGVKPPMVSKVEDGLVRPVKKLEKWAKAYGIGLEHFKTLIEWNSELPLWGLCARLAREDAKKEEGFIDTRRKVRSA